MFAPKRAPHASPTTISDTIPVVKRLTVAVRVKGPAQLAQAFASQVGQFYDRTEFDALARQTSDLYSRQNAEHASHFRSRLDRRLYDRYHAPVAWQVDARYAADARDGTTDRAA